jgi:hypothetical protein
MSNRTPLDLLSSSHVAALVEVIRADSYVLGVKADDLESMSLLAVTLAMHRISCEMNKSLLDGGLDDRVNAVQLVLREASALLDVAPIAMSEVAPDLRLLERLSILVLDELINENDHRPTTEEPF